MKGESGSARAQACRRDDRVERDDVWRWDGGLHACMHMYGCMYVHVWMYMCERHELAVGRRPDVYRSGPVSGRVRSGPVGPGRVRSGQVSSCLHFAQDELGHMPMRMRVCVYAYMRMRMPIVPACRAG